MQRFHGHRRRLELIIPTLHTAEPRNHSGLRLLFNHAKMEIFIISLCSLLIAALIAAMMKISSLKADNSRLRERLDIIDREEPQRRQADEDRFKVLAREVLAANADSLARDSRQQLTALLDPLRGKIEEFSRSVSDCYSAEARERFALKERIRELIELNNSIGREARDLTLALRGGNKTQGNWGEMVLESLLENSGLRRGEEFEVQSSASNDAGATLRPDVVVNYPGGRCVVIDSKVSLTAYLDLIDAGDTAARKAAESRHLASVKSHIAELRRKNYSDFVGRRHLDFVMMFIPNEPAYAEAMRLDPRLWQQAYDARVIIVSPTLLMASLRLIEQLWQTEAHNRNATEIAVAAGRMLDKFVSFTDDLAKIRKALNQAADAHAEAMKKLSEGNGNLMSRARKLRDLGAKSTRPLPQTAEEDETEY